MNEETSINFSGEWDSDEAARLSEAFFDAIAIQHKLPDSVRYMEGMSGKKYRYLINNLVGSTPDARYLEIGSWKGSTACSAMYRNTCTAVCIDDWSETMRGVVAKESFLKNTSDVVNEKIKFSFIEKDFNQVDFTTLGKFNIYMYDGSHAEQDQYTGISIVQPALDDVYTLIVDDWNGADPQNGTLRALSDLGQRIIARIDIVTRRDGIHPAVHSEHSDWHNGYCIAVISKT